MARNVLTKICGRSKFLARQADLLDVYTLKSTCGIPMNPPYRPTIEGSEWGKTFKQNLALLEEWEVRGGLLGRSALTESSVFPGVEQTCSCVFTCKQQLDNIKGDSSLYGKGESRPACQCDNFHENMNHPQTPSQHASAQVCETAIMAVKWIQECPLQKCRDGEASFKSHLRSSCSVHYALLESCTVCKTLSNRRPPLMRRHTNTGTLPVLVNHSR